MANRRPQNNQRRMDYGRNDRGPKNFGRAGVSPWQGGGPGAGISNLLPLGGASTEATLALANNLITNLLQSRQPTVPSLLDMPIRRDFGPDLGRFDRGYGGPNRMGNQGNFRRTGHFNRSADRMNNRKFKPADGPRNQNRTNPRKEADFKPKPVKESSSEVKEGDATTTSEAAQDSAEKKEAPKTRYDDLNPSLLKCHICNKSMWDGRSFENHLSGRAHAIMMQKTAESYALTADTMRQEFKIREMKRNRKTGQQTSREFYCAMCDLYAADGAGHRTTVGHRKLKKFLHPACNCCRKEMPTRIELDEHRLTPEHLKNIHDKQEDVSKARPEVLVISTLAMEQKYVRDDRYPRRYRPENDRERRADGDREADGDRDAEADGERNAQADGDRNAEAEADGEQPDKGEEKSEGAEQQDPEPEVKKEVTEGEGATEVVANENLVLDYTEGDDLTNITTEMVPDYSTERSVGRSFLEDLRCVQCVLCHKILDSDETAEVHLRTWRHHQLFVKMLRDKSGLGGDTNKRAIKQEPTETEAKRRRTDSDGEQNGHNEEDAEPKDEPQEGNELAILSDVQDDVELPSNEDWQTAVDDILDDEMGGENGQTNEEAMEAEAPAEELVPEPVKEKTPPPAETPKVNARGTPARRGRPRKN